LPAVVEQVRTTGTFLGNLKAVVEIDGIIRAGTGALTTSGALLRIDDHKTIFSFVYSFRDRACGEAGGIIAVVAEKWDVMHFDLGDGPPDMLGQLDPELASLRLRFSIRRPIVADMLVLAGDLAAITTVTDRDVTDEDLHYSTPPSTQASKHRPEAGS
jgi:hypothetical protein